MKGKYSKDEVGFLGPRSNASDSLRLEAKEAFAKGDVDRAEMAYLKSWEAVPEPRNQWNESRLIVYQYVKFYHAIQNWEKAKYWIDYLSECYISPYDSTLFVEAGEVYYDSGDLENALKYFEIAFEMGGRIAFEERDLKYYKFLKTAKKPAAKKATKKRATKKSKKK